jgi:hypothetical protein
VVTEAGSRCGVWFVGASRDPWCLDRDKNRMFVVWSFEAENRMFVVWSFEAG